MNNWENLLITDEKQQQKLTEIGSETQMQVFRNLAAYRDNRPFIVKK